MRTLALALVSIVLLAGSTLAATQDLTVSAQVVGTCQFNSAADVNFGTLDQTLTANPTASGSLLFWCTKNASYLLGDENNPSVGDGKFNGNLTGTVNKETIAYQLDYTNYSGQGDGKNSPITSVITATIPNANYINVSADIYTDTVTFTVTP